MKTIDVTTLRQWLAALPPSHQRGQPIPADVTPLEAGANRCAIA